jgi:hypothetical protein
VHATEQRAQHDDGGIPMVASQTLRAHREAILEAAIRSLERDRSTRYQTDRAEDNAERLGRLFDSLMDSMEQREPSVFADYVGMVAEQRFRAGFGLGDVLTACNALEMAIKACLVVDLRPDELGRLSPLVHEVLQAGKRSVVACYLSESTRASRDHGPPEG